MSEEVVARLKDRATARKIGAWSSAWWDLRAAAQMIHSRTLLPVDDGHSHIFSRKGIIDGAIAAYGRHFVDSTRRDEVDLLPLINSLGDAAVDIHEQALSWRHRNVAHRVESEWEQIEVEVYWVAKDQPESVGVRASLSLTLTPAEEFIESLGEHCHQLANLVWEKKLTPLKDRYLSNPKNASNLQTTRQYHSRPTKPRNDTSTDELNVTLNI